MILSNNVAPSDDQVEAIMLKMETHDCFAKRQITKLGPLGSDKHSTMWHEFTEILNAMGPAIKTPPQWQNFWNKMRLKAKGAVSTYLYNSRQTGHNNTPLPDDDDLRISKIFGASGAGCTLVPEVGVYSEHSNEEDLFMNMYDEHEDVDMNASISEAPLCSIVDNWVDCSNNILDSFTLTTSQFVENINKIVSNRRLTITVERAQLHMILNSMKKNPNLAQKKLSEAEQFDAWTSLVEFLNISGPNYDIFTWMMYWDQLVADATERLTKITTDSKCRAKLNDTEKDILNLVDGIDAPLMSMNKPPKGRSTLVLHPSPASTLPVTTPSAQAKTTIPISVNRGTFGKSPTTAAQKSLARTVHGSPLASVPSSTSTSTNAKGATFAFPVPAKTSTRTSSQGLQSKSIEALETGNEILRDISNKLDEALNRHVQVIDQSLSQFNRHIESLIENVTNILPPGQQQQVPKVDIKAEEALYNYQEDYDGENEPRFCPGNGDSDCECMDD